jgi:lipopolysaccharide transport system permease protein
VWWVLEPALYVAVLYMVFGAFLVRGRSTDFVVFLVCGQIPFLWFAKSVNHACLSILSGRGLINQIQIPKSFFPLLVVFQDVVKQLFVFVFMLVFLLWYGLEPSMMWFLMGFVMATQLLLIIAIALFVAAVTPFLPDFRYVVSTGMTLMMFVSGIFYSYKDVILEKHQALFLLNPVANLLKNYRQVLMDNSQPDWMALFSISSVSLVAIGAMFIFYRKFDTAYARLVLQ